MWRTFRQGLAPQDRASHKRAATQKKDTEYTQHSRKAVRLRRCRGRQRPCGGRAGTRRRACGAWYPIAAAARKPASLLVLRPGCDLQEDGSGPLGLLIPRAASRRLPACSCASVPATMRAITLPRTTALICLPFFVSFLPRRLVCPRSLWYIKPYGSVSQKSYPGAARKDRAGRRCNRGTGCMAVAERDARPPTRTQVPALFRPGREMPGSLRQRVRQGRPPAHSRQGDALSFCVVGQAAARF